MLSEPERKAGRLLIGIGNPSRGDDALGPLAIARLEAMHLPDTELLSDFQLQVEYLLDLEGRAEVIFIDATLDPAVRQFSFQAVHGERDRSHSSHALSPQAVLAAYVQYHGRPPPPAFVLAIRGHRFELGEGLSEPAAAALEAALAFLRRRLDSA